jgi:hypothetical protein
MVLDFIFNCDANQNHHLGNLLDHTELITHHLAYFEQATYSRDVSDRVQVKL